MEAKELMVDDWVYDENNAPYQINTIGQTYCTDKVLILLFTEMLKPIPLTEEILKANGFEKNDNVQGWQYPNDRVIFCLEELSNVFIWNGVYNDICIEHVHVLQHVLRLCGLNELADNFKVE